MGNDILPAWVNQLSDNIAFEKHWIGVENFTTYYDWKLSNRIDI